MREQNTGGDREKAQTAVVRHIGSACVDVDFCHRSRPVARKWYSSAVNGDCVRDEQEQDVVVQGSIRSVAPACVALYLAVVLGLLLTILHRDDGIFTYTLDDP